MEIERVWCMIDSLLDVVLTIGSSVSTGIHIVFLYVMPIAELFLKKNIILEINLQILIENQPV